MHAALKTEDTAARPADENNGNPHQDHRALRFLTCGSVDDGKSTLIGRLLFDSRAILADQIDALERKAAGTRLAEGGPAFDLSLLTDGLEAEREQGITIDVAYRYFATPKRKFIIADAPGHEQYTRNMVTAAAGSDAAVVLVDITKIDWQAPHVALLPQTRRHTLLAHLLRVGSIVFAVNKLDAVAEPQAAFEAVRQALLKFCAGAGISPAGIVPVSALRGDNVTQALNMAWYPGPSLLQVLESLPAVQERAEAPLLLPVQYVAREANPGAEGGIGHQPRTLWGRIAHGRVKAGDAVQLHPGGQQAVVVEVRRAGSTVAQAEAGQSAGLVLDRQLDVSRGDWIAAPGRLRVSQRISATLAWLDEEPALPGRKLWVRHGNRWLHGRIVAIDHRLDIHTLEPVAALALRANDIGRVQFEVQQALPFEPYAHNRMAGSLIVVDPATHRTSGALLVRDLL